MGAETNATPLVRVADLLAIDGRFAALQITKPHDELLSITRGDLVVTIAGGEVWDTAPELLAASLLMASEGVAAVVLVGRPRAIDLAAVMARGVSSIVDANIDSDGLFIAIFGAFELLEARGRAESRGRWLQRYRYELGELIEIARALTTERDLDKLLGLILEKARFITGADAGSVYVVEGEASDIAQRSLRFKTSQNDSIAYESGEFVLPINTRSMAGAVALGKKPLNISDVYDLPATTPFQFDRSFDERMGYRSKSMLVVPMVSSQGEIVGVLQLINKKRTPRARLRPETVEHEVVPFDEHAEELVRTLSAQAGIAMENAILYTEINHIFAGFVTASVEAIEQRDPTTSGHSRRVATLTVALAEVVDRIDTGAFATSRFVESDLREIEIASLLHDFGKIGVREQILIKAKKLFDWQLQAIRGRFDFAQKAHEVGVLTRRCQLLERGAKKSELDRLDDELITRRHELDRAWQAILASNEPTVLRSGDFTIIEAVGKQTYIDMLGVPRPLLSADEIASLSIPRGSLTNAEIDEIRSHVVHTHSFLRQIPWGRAFRRIPTIAGCHHEKLNGSGYPQRLKGEEIPLQSRMMSIADIFDALTASDRPYKRAVPVRRALDILGYEVKDGALDAELVRLFIDAQIWTKLDHDLPMMSQRLVLT